MVCLKIWSPEMLGANFFVFFFLLNFFSDFWTPNELLVFIGSNPLMSLLFWVYLKSSRCFLWEVVAVWGWDARNSWKFVILQISQNMTKLAILTDLTSFILPTSVFELHHSNFGESIATIICAYIRFQTWCFSLLVPSWIVKTLRFLKSPPPQLLS